MNQQAKADQTVRIQRTFNAKPDQVFAAWTDAGQLAQWFGPPGYTVRVPCLEPRADGRFQFEMAPPDDSPSRFIVGKYLESKPGERLVFTWAWQDELDDDATRGPDSVVTVELIARKETTELILTHERLADEEAAAAHRRGWEGSLHCLEEFLS